LFFIKSILSIYFLIAAAKLANATKRIHTSSTDITTNNSIKHKHHHHHHHHHKKITFNSPNLNPTGSSVKSIISNGSGGENFSTDDAEEVNNSKTPLSTNNDNKKSSTSKLDFIIMMFSL
jgi:hypothetical protein